jgi:drug/metabolite transporter (DMT)-like permease
MFKSSRLSPGAGYIMLATVFFALMNIGVKYLDRIPAHEIVLFRALVTLIAGYIMLKRKELNPWGNNKKILFLRGLTGTIALICYFYTLQTMPLASAVTIQYLSPIFTIIISVFILKETTGKIQALFFVLAFGGVILVKGFDPRVSIPELTIGIIAAIFSALAYNFVRKLKDYDHPLVVVFYFPLVTFPVVGVYTLFSWVTPEGIEWLILLFVGLTTTIAQIFLTKAFHADRASNIGIFNYLGTVYAIIIGFFLFNEAISVFAYLGFGLIIFSVIMAQKFRKKI